MMRSFLCLCVLLCFAPTSFAAKVVKVKGKGALIDLQGDPAAVGDTFYAVKSDGKRAAVLKVSKVKGTKAIAKVLKGKAAAGMSLEFKGAGKSAKGHSDTASASEDDGVQAAGGRSYWGALVGYGMDSMEVTVHNSITGLAESGKASLSGGGLSAKGLFDYEMFSQIWFRGTAGLEQFNVSGPARCGTNNTQACDAKIMYMTFDFLGRFVFATGNFRPWVGGGVGLLFPASKSASALQASSISTTNVIVVGGGFDFFISPTMYIPISIEYGLLPKSEEVDAKWIAVRAGFAVPF